MGALARSPPGFVVGDVIVVVLFRDRQENENDYGNDGSREGVPAPLFPRHLHHRRILRCRATDDTTNLRA